MENEISRRHALKMFGIGAAGVMLSACAPMDEGSEGLVDILKKFSFTGQDGKPVNVAKLSETTKGKFATVSFGFDGCNALCPRENNVLFQLGKGRKGKMVSIIINVNPNADGATQESRDTFASFVKRDGVEQEVITLFPKQNEVLAAQNAFGAIGSTKDNKRHSSMMYLYAPDGKLLAEVNAGEQGKETAVTTTLRNSIISSGWNR